MPVGENASAKAQLFTRALFRSFRIVIVQPLSTTSRARKLSRGTARLRLMLSIMLSRMATLTLAAFAREAETKTLDLLERSLSGPSLKSPGPAIEHKLLDSAARDVEELLPLLEPRAAELADLAIQKLRQRGEGEEKDLRETLEKQRNRVREELAKSRCAW
jgi:hypothetical protein